MQVRVAEGGVFQGARGRRFVLEDSVALAELRVGSSLSSDSRLIGFARDSAANVRLGLQSTCSRDVGALIQFPLVIHRIYFNGERRFGRLH